MDYDQFQKAQKSDQVFTAHRIDQFCFIHGAHFPWKWTSYLCAQLGVLGFYLVKKERLKTIAHLTTAYGHEKSSREIFEMARKVFYNLGRGAAELGIKLNADTKTAYFSNVEVEGVEHAFRAVEEGKGIIMIIPHLGCWEALPKAWTVLGVRGGAVGKPLKNEQLNNWVLKNREFNGFQVLPRGSSYKTILQFLKQNNSLGMLIDQDTSVKGVFVDFFGKPAYTPIGAAMLALDTEAVVLTSIYVRTSGNRYKLICSKPIETIRTGNREEELQLNTERYQKAIEVEIKHYPEQWVWMHERWKTTPKMVSDKAHQKQAWRKKRRELKAEEILAAPFIPRPAPGQL
ncbi:MAG: lysophospholipid acyltransferase family protein [Cyclobacteriaceae bacterium]|nr:lysophospholipid acyltransferase family protein [Cyclobacteriaceae bacterium]